MGKIAKFLGIPFCSFPRGKKDSNANKKSKNLMELWLEATLEKQKENDKKVKEILRVLLNGYRSTLDYPSCIFYKELLELCPDAKVLLTIRDSPEVWAESVTSSIGLLVNYVDCWYHHRCKCKSQLKVLQLVFINVRRELRSYLACNLQD